LAIGKCGEDDGFLLVPTPHQFVSETGECAKVAKTNKHRQTRTGSGMVRYSIVGIYGFLFWPKKKKNSKERGK